MTNLNFSRFFNNKKVLITGGTGMIGRSIVDLLSNFNCKVTTVSLDNISLFQTRNW